ncbi:TonB-dependent receptor [Persicitalea jodogahamensis]|uniref:TonB-dependent receptor n=1 Tax=Persicitalea jodogahamensis TaxID=402147 RepID=A0A8J3D0S5_9BACT|nr:TonB-dependent receptor [Persicitalea jodogahamensis]GHB59731.1 TonB-dependent receptor [Persicitalea jodogahamensis]
MNKKLLVLLLGLFAVHSPLFGQQAPIINATISGTVLDARTNEKLPGCSVVIQGTTNGAVTDANGEFTLVTGQKLPFTLVATYVGYQKKEIIITGSPVEVRLEQAADQLDDVLITSRRRPESSQEVPIPISVIRGATAEDAGAFNVNRLKELVPTVQLYSSNPRNTTLNIRGLGSTFGLTNDGIDPGVGFYVDGVYYARPAATTLDFIDIEQIEVLRGPQGTLFGKNTTAGAFNITTRAASFQPGASFEVSYGNFGYIQAKTSLTGPLSKKLAGRISFSATQRNGLLYNVATQSSVNDLNNLGARGQLLYTPSDNVKITLAADNSRQNPNGYAQVIAGVVTTKRAPYRQFNNIIADLNYALPSTNPFDRIIDHDTPWRSKSELGGVSLNVEAKIGPGTLAAISAWRYWNWAPSNDRDFTGLPVITLSQAPSRHQQWTQEIRYSANLSSRLSGVLGVFAIWQDLKSTPYQTEESGAAQWRFAQNSTSPLWRTPGLLDGYGIQTTSRLQSFGGAAFGQLDWSITDKLHLLSGLRFNYDQKEAAYNRQTYGGLQTSDPALLAIKNTVYSNQQFDVQVDESNFSGQLTLAYRASKAVNAYATYANSYKPVGVNLGGLPSANGKVLTELAKIKPEYVTHYEMGIKTRPLPQATLNFSVYDTDIQDYQTQVQTAEPGVNRGYLANAERVRVMGAELDGNIRVSEHLTVNGAGAYTDGKYVSFTNAPVPLEEVGGEIAYKDISGGALPGISRWSGSLGGEFSGSGKLISLKGRYFVALDTYYRSSFSSSPSPSRYLNIDGYALLNGRLGFRASNGISVLVWSRNLLDKNYFEQLLPASGSAGQYAAVLGDQRTFGVTLRYNF